MKWTLLNAFVALAGYYVAAALVDKPWYGRVRMQVRIGSQSDTLKIHSSAC